MHVLLLFSYQKEDIGNHGAKPQFSTLNTPFFAMPVFTCGNPAVFKRIKTSYLNIWIAETYSKYWRGRFRVF